MAHVLLGDVGSPAKRSILATLFVSSSMDYFRKSAFSADMRLGAQSSRCRNPSSTGNGQPAMLISISHQCSCRRRYGRFTHFVPKPNVRENPIQDLFWLLDQDNTVERAWLAASATKHIFQLFPNEQFCGYRSMQMVMSSLAIDFPPADQCEYCGASIRRVDPRYVKAFPPVAPYWR